MGWLDKYQDGGDTHKIDSILGANKHLPWVKRLYDKDGPNIQLPGVDGTSTHYMSQIDNYALPLVDELDGKLQYIEKPSIKRRDSLGIKFKSPEEALWFTENYKKGTGVLPKAQAGITKSKNENAWNNEERKRRLPPERPEFYLKDNRKISATTEKLIDPNVDLISREYDLNMLDNFMQYAKSNNLSKEDMWNLAAMDMQETGWGTRSDAGAGHAKGSWGGKNTDESFVNAYIHKMKLADELGATSDIARLQIYNGTDPIYRHTEKDYHGYEMKSAYGVPIPDEGLDMRKLKLYGKRVVDYRDNVLKKNPEVVNYIDSTYNAKPTKKLPIWDNKPIEPTSWEKSLEIGHMPASGPNSSFRKQHNWLNQEKFQDGGWIDKYEDGGVIKDNRGQWAHPREITEIGSNQITMKGVPYPVLGVSDTGDQQMMYPNQEYKFKGNKVTEYPMAQNGETLQPKEFLLNYINSPKYKERLESSGYDNVSSEVKYRKNNLEDTILEKGKYHPSSKYPKVSVDEKEEGWITSHHNPFSSTVWANSRDDKRFGAAKGWTEAHELGHAVIDRYKDFGEYDSSIDSDFETDSTKYRRTRLNNEDNKQLRYRLKSSRTGKPWLSNRHDWDPGENKADLDSFRYQLHKQGIYDAGTEDFTKEHLDKIKQLNWNSRHKEEGPMGRRLQKNYSDEDLIWLMNNVAQTNKNSNKDVAAQNGIKLQELEQIPNFVSYSKPQPGGWLSKYPKL